MNNSEKYIASTIINVEKISYIYVYASELTDYKFYPDRKKRWFQSYKPAGWYRNYDQIMEGYMSMEYIKSGDSHVFAKDGSLWIKSRVRFVMDNKEAITKYFNDSSEIVPFLSINLKNIKTIVL